MYVYNVSFSIGQVFAHRFRNTLKITAISGKKDTTFEEQPVSIMITTIESEHLLCLKATHSPVAPPEEYENIYANITGNNTNNVNEIKFKKSESRRNRRKYVKLCKRRGLKKGFQKSGNHCY